MTNIVSFAEFKCINYLKGYISSMVLNRPDNKSVLKIEKLENLPEFLRGKTIFSNFF